MVQFDNSKTKIAEITKTINSTGYKVIQTKLKINEEYNNVAVFCYLPKLRVSKRRNNACGCLPIFL